MDQCQWLGCHFPRETTLTKLYLLALHINAFFKRGPYEEGGKCTRSVISLVSVFIHHTEHVLGILDVFEIVFYNLKKYTFILFFPFALKLVKL